MPESFVVARYRAMLNGRAPGPVAVSAKPEPRVLPELQPPGPAYMPEVAARLLMKAVSMSEIREAANLLGLTFHEAYVERARLYKVRWGI
jgi:hypothetical protein